MKLPKPKTYGKLPSLDLNHEEPSDIPDVDVKTIRLSKKAPMKQIKANVKALTARGQKFKITEFMRYPYEGNISNDYEILDEDENVLGIAKVRDSIITEMVYEQIVEYYSNDIVASALLELIVEDADRGFANLSVMVEDTSYSLKTQIERFGFRRTIGNIYKRNHGSIRPPTVIATPGL